MIHYWKIQYKLQNFDNIFSSLKEHMFSRKLIQKYNNNRIDIYSTKKNFLELLKENYEINENHENHEINKRKLGNRFGIKTIKKSNFLLNFSNFNDSYFWLFQFLKTKDYEDIVFKSENLEVYNKERISFVEELKKMKIKHIPEIILNDTLDFISFIKLLNIYQFNIFVFWKGKRFFYTNIEDNENINMENTNIIELDEDKINLINIKKTYENDDEDKINQNKENEIKKRFTEDKIVDFYKITNIDKPLYAIGRYKVDELKDIYKKLFITTNVMSDIKLKKIDIYNKIKNYMIF